MFLREWRLERGDAPLQRVAIVDDDPSGQFLYPEFVRFRNLFQSACIEAVICCDPRELEFIHGKLLWTDKPIDLVYNRLTNFGLVQPERQALLLAYLSASAVVTPHPRVHTLYADKRNHCFPLVDH